MKSTLSFLFSGLIATTLFFFLSIDAAATPAEVDGTGGGSQGGKSAKEYSECVRACYDALQEDLEQCSIACTYCSRFFLGLICVAVEIDDNCAQLWEEGAMIAFQACLAACEEE